MKIRSLVLVSIALATALISCGMPTRETGTGMGTGEHGKVSETKFFESPTSSFYFAKYPGEGQYYCFYERPLQKSNLDLEPAFTDAKSLLSDPGAQPFRAEYVHRAGILKELTSIFTASLGATTRDSGITMVSSLSICSMVDNFARYTTDKKGYIGSRPSARVFFGAVVGCYILYSFLFSKTFKGSPIPAATSIFASDSVFAKAVDSKNVYPLPADVGDMLKNAVKRVQPYDLGRLGNQNYSSVLGSQDGTCDKNAEIARLSAE